MTDNPDPRTVEVAPLKAHGSLAGFLLLHGWPRDTVEWARLLVLTVRLAAVPGLLPASTVFRVSDGLTDDVHPGAVGIIMAAGRVTGEGALHPGDLAHPQPPGLIVLHPPGSTVASLKGYETASGCVFLPGLPHLGLDHRAAWVQADQAGTITQLVSRGDVDPYSDVDTAALASLMAA